MLDQTSILERELSSFAARLEDLIHTGHEAKWAVIQDDNLLGTYDDPLAAYTAGAVAFGTQRPFLVRQISREIDSPKLTTLSVGAVRILPARR